MATRRPRLHSHQSDAPQYIKTLDGTALIHFRYLATGSTFTDLHYSYQVGISTIASIVRQVCRITWDVLKTECMPEPSLAKWQEIRDGYETCAYFPNCIGALDGEHVRLSLFLNYKHYFSIVLLAICDANYYLSLKDVGAFGKNCDSNVFKNSVLSRVRRLYNAGFGLTTGFIRLY
jgi:hypothetical protein